MDECIFCKIVNGEMNADHVYRDDELIALNDVNPQAPVHFLLMPVRHIATTNDLTADDTGLIGRMVLKAKELAMQNPELEKGYRLVLNCNSMGGQAVYHIHLHVLGGRRMTWPPG